MVNAQCFFLCGEHLFIQFLGLIVFTEITIQMSQVLSCIQSGGMANAQCFFLCRDHLFIQRLGLAVLAELLKDNGQIAPCEQRGGMVNAQCFFLCGEHLFIQHPGFTILPLVVELFRRVRLHLQIDAPLCILFADSNMARSNDEHDAKTRQK